MTVIRADVLGFCAGVRSAVTVTEKTLSKNTDGKVYSLGPLIHNQVVLDSLSQKGLIVIDENNINSIENKSTVIIRAHGVPPETIAQLEEKECKIVDATCHLVRASQKIAEKYSNQNYRIIFAGDAFHGEVISVAGFAKNNFTLLQNSQDAQNLEISNTTPAVLFSQTTFNENAFHEISDILQKKCSSLVVLHTICSATRARQDALKKLCTSVEAVVVVGGKNSANTKRLLLTAESLKKEACIVERADEIPAKFFNYSIVGLTAGASTPDNIIDEVEKKLLAISKC